VWDKDLPIQKEAVIELTIDHESETDKLLEEQAIVCALFLRNDTFVQEVPFESSISFKTVGQLNSIDTYSAEFHSEHIRHSYAGHAGKYNMYVEYSGDEKEAKR
jgi:hypothetical protein